MTTQEFINQNLDADIRRLALAHAGRKDIDLPYALDQIAGRQTARTKLPRWAATEGIIYPPHISMEQCSSQQTAMYKAAVMRRLITELPVVPALPANPSTIVDLTGGFGVDFSYLAPLFGKAVYIERQSRLCDISRHNMAALGISQAEVVCGDCGQIMKEISHATLVYADPARRSQSGGRTFAIADCTPDVLSMRDMLLEKADYVMIKLSPMLDWRKAAADMGPHVGEVHIVSAGNECKELLLVLSRKYTKIERICCVNDGQEFTFTPEELSRCSQFYHNALTALPSSHAGLPLRAERLADEGRMLRPPGTTLRRTADKPRQPPVLVARGDTAVSRPGLRHTRRDDDEQARAEGRARGHQPGEREREELPPDGRSAQKEAEAARRRRHLHLRHDH